MSKLVSIMILIAGVSTAQAVEPFRLILTDIEKNIYKETARIEKGDVTPDCPVSWSVRKDILHGGRQEGVEIILMFFG